MNFDKKTKMNKTNKNAISTDNLYDINIYNEYSSKILISIDNMDENKEQLNLLLDKEFKCFIGLDYKFYNLLYFNNKLYYVYLTICSIKNNINKEIILQIIYNNLANNLILWFKRGRIDDHTLELKVNDKTSECSGLTYYNIFDLDKCIEKFKNIFEENTGYVWNDYDDKTEYIKKLDKYKIIKIKTIKNECADNKKHIKKQQQNIEMDQKTQDFINNIMSHNNRNKKYEQYKLKLENLSEKNLYDGIQILEKIKQRYSLDGTSDDIISLTELFTNCIPIICMQCKLKVITHYLADVFIKEIIDAAPYINDNISTLDADLQDFNSFLHRIDINDPFYNIIKSYINTNNGGTHDCNISIIDIFKYNKKNTNFVDHGKNQYLFHGSRFSNIYSILQSGLKIAPKNIPRNGAMFGYGLYFANCSTKSFNYCMAELFNNIGCILLCKVSLGESLHLKKACHYSQEYLDNSKCNSLYCPGRLRPDKSKHLNVDNTIVPIGNLIEDVNHGYQLIYDEYICFDINQAQIEYVIYCNLQYKR